MAGRRYSWEDHDADIGASSGPASSSGSGMREGPLEGRRPSWSRGHFERHAWEEPAEEEEGPAEGEERPAVGVDDADAREGPVVDEDPNDSDSDWEPTVEKPEEDFCNEMISLYIQRTLNARQCCRAMWFAGRAGNRTAT